MTEQSKAHARRLANERDLYRYNRALARGDFETLTKILEIASQNADLERMIYAMHDLDQSTAAAHSESQLDNVSTPVAFSQAQNNHAPKTRKGSGPPRRGRVLFQMFAALLMTAVLITGSVLLFNSHRLASQSGATVSTSTKTAVTAQGTIILLLANGVVQAQHGGTGQLIWNHPTGQTVGTDVHVYSTLVVKDQVVYVAIQRTVYALREDNGKLLWQKSLTVPGQVVGGPGNGLSQLIVDSGIIYDDIAGNSNSVAYALRASDGKILWQASTIAWTTPIVAASNGVAYVAVEDANAQTVLQARSGSNGQVLWSYNSAGMISFGTVFGNVFYVYAFPGAVPPGGATKLNKRLLAFNTSNGDILWSHNVSYGNYTANIAYAQGTLIIPNGSQICVHSSSTGNLLWCTQDESTEANSPNVEGYVLGADKLYIAYLSSHLAPAATPCSISNQQSCVLIQNLQFAALDYQTGHVQWTSKQFPYSADLFSLTLLQQKTLLFTDSSSQLTALDTSNGHQLWQINEPAHQSAIVTMITVA